VIPARGSVFGARYSYVDRRAPHAKLTYRLQTVGTDGSPVRARPRVSTLIRY